MFGSSRPAAPLVDARRRLASALDELGFLQQMDFPWEPFASWEDYWEAVREAELAFDAAEEDLANALHEAVGDED